MVTKRIYLDSNATTFLDPRVLQVMIQELEEESGNPSSTHFHGQKSRQKIDNSRRLIAHYLQVKPHEIFFTSGGTEGANWLIQGFLQQHHQGHIITSNVEHACVYQTLQAMEKKGVEVSFLPTGKWGAIHPQAVQDAIRPSTKCIILMAANNETGVKTDITTIAEIAQRHGIPLIVDGVALLGKEPCIIPAGVSAMFFSGHKIHAPKGIGFVFCRSSFKLAPLMLGGSQELGKRAGSENLSGIVGLAKAIEILDQGQDVFTAQMQARRDQLEQGILNQIPNVIVNGEGPRIVNTSNLSFLGVDGESLLISLDMEGISVSHGSACSSGALEPSRILLNMGIPLAQARSAIRFSVSRMTTEEEIDSCLMILKRLLDRFRGKM